MLNKKEPAMKLKTIFLTFLIITLLLLSSCTQGTSTHITPKMQEMTSIQQIEHLLANPSLAQAIIGVYVEELGTGKVVYSQNEHKLLMPASNMKIVTTASVLSTLGPDFTYKTNIYTDGEISDGVLIGNLYIQGSGDPSITARYFGDKADSALILWAEKLSEMGVKKINGKIFGDHSIYADHGIGYGWEKEDLPYYYCAKTYGLSFNDNCVDMTFLPGEKIGDPVKIIQSPVENYLELDNQMITVPTDSSSKYDFYRDYLSDKLLVTGQLPIDGKMIKWSTTPDPADYLLSAFSQVLINQGISYEEYTSCNKDNDYSEMTLLFTHESVPMSDIVNNINKISNNYYAETILKTMDRSGKITTKDGIKVEKEFLSSIGIDTDRMFIKDGSGLSRHNLVTVNQIASILKYMYTSKNWEIFKESLPVGGVDGTVKNRLKGSNAKGHVFAKTGYVGHVRALSGFVEAQNGKTYVFSVIANHYPVPTSAINNLQDNICTILYNQN